MQRARVTTLLAAAIFLFEALPAHSASVPKYRMRTIDVDAAYYPLVGGPTPLDQAPSRTWGQSRAVGAPPPGSPGYRIGETTYDYQHNGSTGRQVDQANGVIQAVWMKGTQNQISLGRNVFWNKRAVSGSPANITLNNGTVLKALPMGIPLTSDGTPAGVGLLRGGYANFRNRPNGKGAVFLHDAPDSGLVFPLVTIDQSNAAGVFVNNPITPSPPIGQTRPMIWPHGTIQKVGNDTILHVVGSEFPLTGDDTQRPFYYFRGDLNGAVVTWGTPFLFDSAQSLSAIVEADPNSDDLALVYTRPNNSQDSPGGRQNFADVVYRKSTDGGLNWGSVQTIHHQDTLLEGHFGYTDVAAVYDENGTLHVLYEGRSWRDDDGDGVFELFSATTLYHWNDLRGTLRQITALDSTVVCSEDSPNAIGVFSPYIAKPSITVKPAGAAGIADEILYAIWSQVGPTVTDCATKSDSATPGGYGNVELWNSASSDDGLTWDRPLNITGTQTPACTPGNCHSEHWVSAAARADSGMYLSYVDDSHAGGIAQEEGAWSTSNYMLYAPASRLPVVEPRIAVSPLSFQELHVNPAQSNTVQFTVQNLGNAALTYQVQVTNDDNGQSHVLVENLSSYSNSISPAGAPNILTLTFDGTAPLVNPSEHNWRLSITSNDANNDPGQGGTALDVNLNVFVASPWFTCVRQSFANGARNLAVSSCLALGDQGSGGGLRSLADQSEYIFEASPVITFNSSTPAQRLSWVDMFWNGVQDRSRDSNRAFRAQSGITLQTAVDNPNGDTSLTANIATGTASTTDSVFQVAWEVRTFNDPGYTDGFVAKYTVSKKTDPGFNGIMQFGAAADLDVDSMSAFNDGIASATRQYVGARGGYGDSISYTAQNKWAALFYIPLDALCDNLGEGGQVLDNPTYVYDEGNFNRDSLRIRMGGIIGWNSANFPTDTISDLSVLMKNGEANYSGAAGTIATFAFGAAVSDLSVSDLESKIGKLRSAINSGCVAGCLIVKPGDVNTSGAITSADIIYEVNYVFKGAAEPLPCKANGDVNCSGTVTSADIIYMVNHVFKGQPAPCDICNGSSLALTCN